jgi:hypothetical protein
MTMHAIRFEFFIRSNVTARPFCNCSSASRNYLGLNDVDDVGPGGQNIVDAGPCLGQLVQKQ